MGFTGISTSEQREARAHSIRNLEPIHST
jgi:hypothetical protein